jgi:hypothetical protein
VCVRVYRSGCQLTVTKDKQLLPLANSDLGKERKQVVGNSRRVLTHDTTWVAAGRVEVPQESGVVLVAALASLLRRVALCVDVVGDHSLDTELGVSVRVGGTKRALLRDGNHVGEACSIAIDCRGRREDNVGHVVLLHAAQQAERPIDVNAVVVERDLAGLADGLSSLSASSIMYPTD